MATQPSDSTPELQHIYVMTKTYLQSKVELHLGTDGKLVAFGPEGQTFDYGDEGQSTEGKYARDAHARLGFHENDD